MEDTLCEQLTQLHLREEEEKIYDNKDYQPCIFILNNYQPHEIDIIKGLNYKYLVFGYEVGESGTPHLQGYIEFFKKVKGKTLKSFCKRISWKKRLAKAKSAADYCKKGEQSHEEWTLHGIKGLNYGKNAKFEEYGEISKQGKRNDLVKAVELINQGVTTNDNNLLALNNDILYEILKHLNIHTIGKLAQTSKKYHNITHEYWWANFKQYLTPENASYLTIDSFTLQYPLSVTNKHPLDNYIHFIEEGHLYFIYNEDGTLSDLPRTSVTTLIHDSFPQFDADKIIADMMKRKSWPNSQYYGMTPEEIKLKWKLNGEKSAASGTYMHFNIECHQNGIKIIDTSIHFGYYMNFWNDFKSKYPQFIAYRTEMLIHYKGFRSNTMNLCGSVDFLLEDDDGNIIIMDWKHSKEIKKTGYNGQKGYPPFEHLDNCNLNHYNLQLNIYRHVLEKIYNKNVIFMMLVIFHYNQETYQCIPVDEMDMESIWDQL